MKESIFDFLPSPAGRGAGGERLCAKPSPQPSFVGREANLRSAGALQITRISPVVFPETPHAPRENPASAYTAPARRPQLPTRIQIPCSFRGSASPLFSPAPAPDRALAFPQTRASQFPTDRAAR